MEEVRKPKGHKNFYINLNHPPDFIFTAGDTVSGKCVLLSTHDEDVGQITISFHGTVQSHVVVHTYIRQGNQPTTANYKSEDVLFSESKVVYDGGYTLRKNVPYEWPFEFELPASLPPSCEFGKFGLTGGQNAQIVYELEACRGRTWQDPAAMEKRLNPLNDMKGAPFQPNRLMAKIGSFTGMIALATIPFMPPRPRRVDPVMMACRVDRIFPVISSNQASDGHHKLSSLLHSHKADQQEPNCGIVLELPRNLIIGSSIPITLRVTSSDAPNFQPIHLQSVNFHLKARTIIRSGVHHNLIESKVNLLDQSKTGLAIIPNTMVDLGSTFNIQLNPTVTPTFAHKLIELSYDLEAHLVIECGGKKFKEDFLIESVQVISDRTRSSPLSRDYVCSFSSKARNNFCSSLESKATPQTEVDAEISLAYLALSRLLTPNAIPHNPIDSQTGLPAIIVQGKHQFYAPPSLPSPPSSSTVNATPPNPGNKTEDLFKKDQHILDTIIDAKSGFTALSTPKSEREGPHKKMLYSWSSPESSFPYRSQGVGQSERTILLEISDAYQPHGSSSGSRAPPEYSGVGKSADYTTQRRADLFSTVTLLNTNLRVAADSDPSRGYTSSSVWDILYLIHEFRAELSSNLAELDMRAANEAASKYFDLRVPLASLGMDIDGGY